MADKRDPQQENKSQSDIQFKIPVPQVKMPKQETVNRDVERNKVRKSIIEAMARSQGIVIEHTPEGAKIQYDPESSQEQKEETGTKQSQWKFTLDLSVEAGIRFKPELGSLGESVFLNGVFSNGKKFKNHEVNLAGLAALFPDTVNGKVDGGMSMLGPEISPWKDGTFQFLLGGSAVRRNDGKDLPDYTQSGVETAIVFYQRFGADKSFSASAVGAMGPFSFLSLRGGKKIDDHFQINGGYRLGRGPFIGFRVITDKLVLSFDFTQKGASVDTSHSWEFGGNFKTTSRTSKDP